MARLNNDNYIEIKKKLDSLNYNYPFDMGSCKLVELLVNDIYKMKNEINKIICEKESNKQKNENSELNFKALEYENKRLIKENNELHKEMIELSKKIHINSSAKDIEIKRLSDEKNDLKFLFLEIKNKLQKTEKETIQLKTRLSSILVQIFDSNFSEENLRKMFNEHVFFEVKEGNINTENDNLFGLNYELINYEKKTEKKDKHKDEIITMNKNNELLEITLPKRSIILNQVLEANQLSNVNSTQKINTPLSQTKNTNNNQSGLNLNANNVYSDTAANANLDNALKNTFLKSADELVMQANYHATNNEDSFINLQKKNGFLMKQNEKLTGILSMKNAEIVSLTGEIERIKNVNKYEKTEANNDLVLKFLKDDNQKLTLKYEERINFIIKENKNLQNIISEMDTKLKKKKPVKVLNNDVNNCTKLEKKIKICENEKKSLNSEILYLREKIERFDKNFDISKYVPKELITNFEEKNLKLKNDYNNAQELVLKLNEKIQNLLSSSNSEKVFLKNNIKNLNLQDEFRNNEQNNLNEKIKMDEFCKSDLSEKINNLNSLLTQKENVIFKLNDFITSFKGDYEVLKKDKQNYVDNVTDLEKNINFLRRKMSLKDGEIDRINNINNIFEKEIEILKLKYEN